MEPSGRKFTNVIVFCAVLIIPLLTLWACSSSSGNTLNFEHSLSYRFNFDITEIKKTGEFLVVKGKNKEKVVITENSLDDTLKQIEPPISSQQFFDEVYESGPDSTTVPEQVLDFRDDFIQGKVINKMKTTKKHSTLYLWEFANHVIKAVELANQSGYFLTIIAVNSDTKNFIAP